MIGKQGLLVLASLIAIAVSAASLSAGSGEQTVGLFLREDGAYDGYTLFTPMRSKVTYLVDMDGRPVQTWESDFVAGAGVYLLEDGSLIRPAFLPPGSNPTFDVGGGRSGRVEKLAWDGTLVWEFDYSTNEYMLHHDVEVLPNGNVLMIAWERKTFAEAVEAGRDPSLLRDGELWPEHIIEVEPTGASGGNIVWEWHSWDHLIQDYDPAVENYGVVADHPELIDINYFDPIQPARGAADWQHANGLDYNEALDQIVISVRNLSEIWVIDHSTTTEEAAGNSGGNSGKGGDLLYRWGSPQAYRAGDAGDQQLFVQHDAQWIEPGLPGEGNILVFSNGTGRPGGDYSTVEEIEPPVDASGNYSMTPGEAYEPEEPVWTYAAENPEDFYSSIVSGARRLPNGNTLIDAGSQGTFIEVTPDGNEIWRYVNPVTDKGPLRQGEAIPALFPGVLKNIVFQAPRYGAGFPGLQGRDLTPGAFIELEAKDPSLDTDGDGIPNETDLDDDSDGCLDKEELATFNGSELAGGKRDPHYFWDFYDVWTNGSGEPDGWERDGVILLSDILALVARFGRGPAPPSGVQAVMEALTPPTDRTSYHIAYDRGPIIGAKGWDRAPPDGVINIPDDVLGIASQFGHRCLGASATATPTSVETPATSDTPTVPTTPTTTPAP